MFWLLFAGVMLLLWKLPLKRVGLMCDPTGGVATLALMAVAGGTQAYGQYQQGSAQNKYYQYAAGQSRLAGDAALDRSRRQSELTQDTAKVEGKAQAIKTAKMIGSQKAAMAAMGIDPSSVTASDVVLDSYSKAKLDESMIRYNADMQSWGMEEQGKLDKWQAYGQADQYSMAGKQAKKAGKIQAFTTLLSTAASMGMGAQAFGMFKGAGTSPLAGSTASFGGGAKATSLNYTPASMDGWSVARVIK